MRETGQYLNKIVLVHEVGLFLVVCNQITSIVTQVYNLYPRLHLRLCVFVECFRVGLSLACYFLLKFFLCSSALPFCLISSLCVHEIVSSIFCASPLSKAFFLLFNLFYRSGCLFFLLSLSLKYINILLQKYPGQIYRKVHCTCCVHYFTNRCYIQQVRLFLIFVLHIYSDFCFISFLLFTDISPILNISRCYVLYALYLYMSEQYCNPFMCFVNLFFFFF